MPRPLPGLLPILWPFLNLEVIRAIRGNMCGVYCPLLGAKPQVPIGPLQALASRPEKIRLCQLLGALRLCAIPGNARPFFKEVLFTVALFVPLTLGAAAYIAFRRVEKTDALEALDRHYLKSCGFGAHDYINYRREVH